MSAKRVDVKHVCQIFAISNPALEGRRLFDRLRDLGSLTLSPVTTRLIPHVAFPFVPVFSASVPALEMMSTLRHEESFLII